MISVCGHRVLLKPKNVENVSKGGIVIPDHIADKERLSVTLGTVVDIGSTAWDGLEPWCSVGDCIIYGKYGGKMIEVSGEKFVVINDEDVICRVPKDLVETIKL